MEKDQGWRKFEVQANEHRNTRTIFTRITRYAQTRVATKPSRIKKKPLSGRYRGVVGGCGDLQSPGLWCGTLKLQKLPRHRQRKDQQLATPATDHGAPPLDDFTACQMIA